MLTFCLSSERLTLLAQGKRVVIAMVTTHTMSLDVDDDGIRHSSSPCQVNEVLPCDQRMFGMAATVDLIILPSRGFDPDGADRVTPRENKNGCSEVGK